MNASDYTPLDHACNAMVRLAQHLNTTRQMLAECSDILSGKQEWDSVGGLDDIIAQLQSEVSNLEWMANDASTKWKPVEQQVSESVGRLRVEVPDDSVTWSQYLLDQAWRLWNVLNAQLILHKEPRKIIEGMIGFKNRLEPFEDIELWTKRLAKEFRAGGVYQAEPKEAATDTTKTTRKTTTGKKPKKPRAMNVEAVDCCRRYKADKGQTPMKTIVNDYVEKHGGKFNSIMRILNDNPKQWRKSDIETI